MKREAQRNEKAERGKKKKRSFIFLQAVSLSLDVAK